MEQLIKELGLVKQKIRRLEARSKNLTDELIKLKARKKELEQITEPSWLATSDIGLTTQVCSILADSKEPLTPKEIQTKLEGSGYKFVNVKDPYTMVFATCARLAKNKTISSVKKNNKRAFTIK